MVAELLWGGPVELLWEELPLTCELREEEVVADLLWEELPLTCELREEDDPEELLETLPELLWETLPELLWETLPELLWETLPELLWGAAAELLWEELLETLPKLLEEDPEEELLALEVEDVELLPEEDLFWEYESTGDATMARATIDAIAMLRMFFILQ